MAIFGIYVKFMGDTFANPHPYGSCMLDGTLMVRFETESLAILQVVPAFSIAVFALLACSTSFYSYFISSSQNFYSNSRAVGDGTWVTSTETFPKALKSPVEKAGALDGIKLRWRSREVSRVFRRFGFRRFMWKLSSPSSRGVSPFLRFSVDPLTLGASFF